MIFAEKSHDRYERTQERLLLTPTEHHIPGIITFGHHLSYNAFPPIGWHYHENSFEFSFLSKGSFTFSTPEYDYPFFGGEIFVSYPNEVHGTNNIPMGVCDLYWFQVDISDENNFLFLNPEAARTMINKLNALSTHILKTELKKTVPLMEQAFKVAQSGEDSQLAACLLQLFLHLITAASAKEAQEISADIKQAVDDIQKHITSDFSLEQLAAAVNLSCSQFKQKFRKQIGMSPRDYINRQKIEFSKHLLLEGKSMTEISMLLNFTSSSYFSTVFKKYTLCTPREYKEKRISP